MAEAKFDPSMRPEKPAGHVGHTWPSPMLTDAHAHLYDCYDRVTFFDSTLDQFRLMRRQAGLSDILDPSGQAPGCLLLAEPHGMDVFASLREQKEMDGGRWRFVVCNDGLSMIAQHEDRDALLLIAGRQIKTLERLEVLSLCSDRAIPDDRPTVWTLEQSLEHDGLAVLPLGAGKWLGSRGRMVDEILDSPLADRICLGDNAGRLARRTAPRHFNEAQKRGVWVLPGSGALPFRSQQSRVGRYGLILDGCVDRESPAASIKRIIQAGGEQPRTYGKPDGLWDFLRLQTAIQVYNRVHGG